MLKVASPTSFHSGFRPVPAMSQVSQTEAASKLTAAEPPPLPWVLLPPPGTERPDMLADFLLETLVARQRILARGAISYQACRTWRGPIKPHQVKALKLLKTDPPVGFVNRIADELIAHVSRAVGVSVFASVAAVPCGHSGPGCLSDRIGRAVAERAGLPFVDVFVPLQVSGSSHPKTNTIRPRMRFRTEPPASVLLVDDVATSGAHLAEATRLLREQGTATFPLAWIAG
jgi:hypothetical protein